MLYVPPSRRSEKSPDRPGVRLSFSPRILPSFCSSASVTLAEPELVMENLTGPAGTVAGVGSQPASDSAIFTSVVGWLGAAAPEPADPPQPASRVAAHSNAAVPTSRSARIEAMTWCLSCWMEHRGARAVVGVRFGGSTSTGLGGGGSAGRRGGARVLG